MTRNEMVADVIVGDILKIRTEYDVIIGRIECLDETTIKISRIDTGKIKRISYEIIVDFDFETADSSFVDIVSRSDNSEGVSIDNHDINENESNVMYIKSKIIDLWGEIETEKDFSVSDGYKEYSKKFPSEVKNDLNSYKEKILYAQKINEFSRENYRVISVMKELSSYQNKTGNKQASCLKAMISYELGRYDEAETYFIDADDYEGAFWCAYKQDKYERCLKYAVTAFNKEDASTDMKKWLFEYANTNKLKDVISLLIDHETDIRLQMLLYLFKDDSCIEHLHDKENIVCEGNEKYLLDIFENNYGKLDYSELRVQTFAEDNLNSKSLNINNKIINETYTGNITEFDTKRHFGFIDNKKVYFYIKQVLDEDLQRMLYDDILGMRVSYTLGRNIYNKIAADTIQLIEPTSTERRTGFISEYNRFEEFGRISCFGDNYNFILNSVVDPYLKADILESNNFDTIDVSFIPSQKNSKRIAIDICAIKDYDEEHISSWLDSKVIKPKEINEWEQKKRKREETSFRVVQYEALVPSNHHNSLGYCFRAQQYLSSGDLQGAKTWYLKAIENGEKLETAVPNLNAVYMRTSQWEKSLNLLDRHANVLKEDVYLNLKVQTLDKLKNNDSKYLDDFIMICEKLLDGTEAIPKKMHFLLKLGQTCIDVGKYNLGLDYYEQWETFNAQNHSGITDGYKQAYIKMLQGKAIALYKLDHIKEATDVANKLYNFKETDSLALAIINGESVEELLPEELAWNEYWRDTQISKYIEDCLKNTNLEVEKGIPNVVDGIYKGDEKSAIKAIKWIIGRKTANDQAKYNNFISAAKLVKQMLDRKIPVYNESKINEQIYQFYIAKAMLFYGDYQLINAKTTNNFDMARYCYLQVTNIFKEVDKVYSCWLDSFLRYIQTFFSDFDVIKKRQAPGNDTCPDEKAKELILTLCDDFNGELLSDTMDFTVGLIELFANNANNKKYGEIVLDRLEKSHLKQTVENSLEQIIACRQNIETHLKKNSYDFKEKWNYAIETFFEIQDKFSTILNRTVNKVFEIEPYMIHELQSHTYLNFLNKSEKGYWEEMIIVLTSVVKYIKTSDFDTKNDLLQSICNRIDRVKKMIDSSATMYSYEFLLGLFESIESQVLNEVESLYVDSKPEITISIPSGQQIYLNEDTGIATVPVNFINKENVQNAESVKVNIETVAPFKFQENLTLRELNIIPSNKNGKSILLYFYADIKDIDMLEFSVSISYKYKVSIFEDMETKEDPVRIAVPLYNQDEFKPIENKFEPYISGNVVLDKNMFFGRAKDIKDIIDIMSANSGDSSQGRALALYGQTRTGKSSLLHHVAAGLRERDLEHNIIINTGSIGDQDLHDKDITELLYTILRTLEKEIKKKAGDRDVVSLGLEKGQMYHPILMANMQKDGINIDPEKVLENAERSRLVFNEMFKGFCEYVKSFEVPYNIVLMIDEFTYIYDWIRQGKMDSSITQWWKALLQNNNIFAIIIGQDHMMQFVNDISISPVISNDFQTTQLKKVTYLSEKDAKALMSEPIQLEMENGMKVSRYKEEALERLYELTSGSAFLIMNFCGKLVNYLNEQKSMYITRSHIDDFLKKNLIEFEESRFFEPQYNDKSEVDNSEIISQNKEILKLIARSSKNREWADISLMAKDLNKMKLIDKLVERDVLMRNGEYKCKIKVALYKEWLIERYGLEG